MTGARNVWTIQTVHDRCVEEGECWIWDQSLNSLGYPQASINGKCTRVQRYLFSELMGRRLPERYVVSQRCGNRACCAPACQIAITYSERLQRSYASGARTTGMLERVRRREKLIRQGWPVKLDMEKARDIRSRSGETHAALALEFGVHPKTIAEIRQNKTWREHSPNLSVFTWRPLKEAA